MGYKTGMKHTGIHDFISQMLTLYLNMLSMSLVRYEKYLAGPRSNMEWKRKKTDSPSHHEMHKKLDLQRQFIYLGLRGIFWLEARDPVANPFREGGKWVRIWIA